MITLCLSFAVAATSPGVDIITDPTEACYKARTEEGAWVNTKFLRTCLAAGKDNDALVKLVDAYERQYKLVTDEVKLSQECCSKGAVEARLLEEQLKLCQKVNQDLIADYGAWYKLPVVNLLTGFFIGVAGTTATAIWLIR